VENSQKSASVNIAPALPLNHPPLATSQAPKRNQYGQLLPGYTANPSGLSKKQPITAILKALIATKEGQKAALQAARKQLRVSGYAPAMATYVRETLEGRLVERVEMSGGLELSARIARARQRLAEQNGSESNRNE
jgi:hypothetical protein